MSFKQTLSQQHRACDVIFAKIESVARAGDWTDAMQVCETFRAETEAHFAYEEAVLFPALERAHPMASQPIAVMLTEHAQIRELATDLRVAIVERREDLLSGALDTLMFLLQQHNAKEENVLYPLADQVLEQDLLPADAQEAGNGQ